MKKWKYSDFWQGFSRVLQVQGILGRLKLVANKAPSNFTEMVNAHLKSFIFFYYKHVS